MQGAYSKSSTPLIICFRDHLKNTISSLNEDADETSFVWRVPTLTG